MEVEMREVRMTGVRRRSHALCGASKGSRTWGKGKEGWNEATRGEAVERGKNGRTEEGRKGGKGGGGFFLLTSQNH